MSHQQIAKMYLRGTLCTQKLKNLSVEDRNEIEGTIETVIQDPLLQRCQAQFCNVLAHTIQNEYHDKQTALVDYGIAIMRAAVAAKFHENGKIINSDPIQRKKWYQNWAFNYMKQILRENKLPQRLKVENIEKPLDYCGNIIAAYSRLG